MRFFKTGKGEYGEGDVFIGLTLPIARSIVKKYKELELGEIGKLLHSKFHEDRMIALVILVEQYKKADKDKQKILYDFYLKNTKYINNWDLVDVTCKDIVGAYLHDKSRQPLFKLAKSANLWERRIAIISTFYFIKESDLDDTYAIAKLLLSEKHDLLHKAVGWALREAGKKDEKRLKKFLEENYPSIPRTTLRYAIEKFPIAERKRFLAGEF